MATNKIGLSEFHSLSLPEPTEEELMEILLLCGTLHNLSPQELVAQIKANFELEVLKKMAARKSFDRAALIFGVAQCLLRKSRMIQTN